MTRTLPRTLRRTLARTLAAALAAAGALLALGAPVSASASAPASAPASASASVSARLSADTVQLDAGWSWPIAAPRVIQQPFRAPASRYSAGHRGIDLEAGAGTEILAPAAGTVFFAGRVVDRTVFTVQHAGGLLSSYEPVRSALSAGDAVLRGEVIGTVATGGHCSERCLHLGVRLHGEYVSPLLLVGGIPRAVLLPLG